MSADGRPLADLVAALEAHGRLRGGGPAAPDSAAQLEVAGVQLDSRKVEPGDVFVAIGGRRQDGLAFAADAVARGAVAVISDRPAAIGAPLVVVDDARAALAVAAAWLNGNPSHQLGVIGVTGTDGKTTTSFLIRSMLAAAGLPTGMISTVMTFIGGQSAGYARETTPEAPVIQAALRRMVDAADRFAVIESTSHGLALQRVAEVAYDIAVLTNITHEHLDLHGSIEAYVAAKRSLFERLAVGPRNPDKGWPKTAVINARDGHAGEITSAAIEAGARVITYSADAALHADVQALAIDVDAAGLTMGVRTRRWQADVRVELAGAYNADNALAALAVGEALELDPAAMRSGIAELRAVPGRMEQIDVGQPFEVYVDFAHTAAALGLVLDGLAPLARRQGGGVIAVFGSSGERDVQKRPMMGRVAGERARAVVVTNEEPRGEDEMTIVEQIAAGAEEAGMVRGRDLFLIADRYLAIRKAFELAGPGDIVVLCGKGHEQTMEMSYGTIPWNEAQIARDTLAEMGYGRTDRPAST